MFIISPDLQSLVQDTETLAAAETRNTEINDAQTHVWLTSWGKSILWSISLQAISTFRAQGLIKYSGGDVCDCFLKKVKKFYIDLNVGDQQAVISYIHCVWGCRN